MKLRYWLNCFPSCWQNFLVLRAACLALTTTWFVPDEIFQSVEVAHKMVFSTGHLSWEWLPENALRSPLHPLFYAATFWLLKVLKWDSACIINWIPNILHVLLFSLADVCYAKFLRQLVGLSNDALYTTMVLYTSNWFLLYCSARTLANTLETALVLIALPLYQNELERREPHRPGGSYHLFLLCATIATIIRPTAALLWVPLIVAHLLSRSSRRSAIEILSVTTAWALPAVVIASAMDSIYYGRPCFCLWNFFKFNLLQGGSASFGVHPWHWYLSNGLPATFTTLFPLLALLLAREIFKLLLAGANDIRTTGREQPSSAVPPVPIPMRYFWTAAFYLAVHSVVAHKEHRFLLSVVPLFLPYLAAELMSRWPRPLVKPAIRLTLLVNIVLALYVGTIHQRGPYAANRLLVELGGQQQQPTSNLRILQLMPCYSLPQYAALHSLGSAAHIRMLDCSPPAVRLQKLQEYPQESLDGSVLDIDGGGEDEADQFHNDPLGWLREKWSQPAGEDGVSSANVVVAYAKIYSRVESFLHSKRFRVNASIFHAHLPVSPNQDSRIVVAGLQLQ